jgi:hypothetical protein
VVLAVIAAVVLAASGAASAVVSAVVTIAIVLAAVTGVAVAAATGLLIWRVRQERPRAPVAARQVSQVPPEIRPALEVPRKPAPDPAGVGFRRAIEPPREIHLHLNVSADELAAIMRHCTEGEK